MGSLSIGHWVVVLIIIMLVFGTKKISNMGSDLGKAVKGFKEGVKGSEEPTASAAAELNQQPIQTTAELKAKEHSVS